MSLTLNKKKPLARAKGKQTDQKKYSDVVDDLQDVINGIPDRPSKGLMTFEELQAQIGAKPKKDRLFGLKKMSTRYKAIGGKLDAVKATLANATVGDIAQEGGRTPFEQDLNDQLNEIVDAGKRYQRKHKGKKGQAVQGLLDDVERFRKEIPGVLDGLTEGEDGGLPEDLPVDQAMAAKRAGIKPGQLKGVSSKHCNFARFNDDTANAPAQELGKGSVNTVQLVKHGGVERVFKKEQQKDTSGAWAPNMMGIDTAKDPRYGNRNIAGGVLGKLLGTKVMPESSFAISGGEVGLLMEMAAGKTAQKLLKDGDLDEASLSPKAMASLQKQLMDLEVCDILTGQTDRHPGNYMIDIKGDSVTVTAIDNDFAFPNPDTALGNKAKVPLNFMGMNSIKNLPSLMSKEIADKIKGIDFDNDIAPEYAGLLSDPEIRGAKTRFETLQEHVAKLEQDGCIVTDWSTWRGPPPDRMTATDFLAEGKDQGSSLFSRDFGDALNL